jgi:hypothetical protein
MTAYPQPPDPNNPYPPPAYVPQYANAMSLRPGAVTVMSILAIVFGSLGLLCGLTGVASQFAMLATGGRNPFAPNVPAMNSGIVVYGAARAVILLALSAVLLAGGIGGLKLRPWARRTLIGWSIALVTWATINLIITLVWVNPATADYMRSVQLRTNPQAAKMMGSMMGPLQTVFAVIGWATELILPVCFLILWRSPRIVAAFESPEVQGFQP